MARDITKTIVVDAAAPVVFRALTDESELVQWMPREAKMEPRVGGAYEFKYYWAAKNATTTAKGKIVELVPNRKLVYTFESDGDGVGARPSLLTWTLEELDEGTRTRVTLVHSGIGGVDSGERYSGWGYYLGQLVVHCDLITAKRNE